MYTSNVNLACYNNILYAIENSNFSGAIGLNEAFKLSDEIDTIQKTIWQERWLQAPEFEELHRRLEQKVIFAQKGSAIIPFLMYLNPIQEKISLEEQYRDLLKRQPEEGIREGAGFFLFNGKLPDQAWRDRLWAKQDSERAELTKKIERCDQVLDERKRLLEPLILGLCEAIKNESDSQGFVFRITNAKGVENYLVGTIHFATDEMADSLGITHAIKNADQLILETASPLLWTLYRMRQLNITNPFRNSIDLNLLRLANQKGLSVEGLESFSEQMQAFMGGVSFADMATHFYKKSREHISEKVNDYFKVMSTGSKYDRLKAYGSYLLAPSIWLFNKEVEWGKWLIAKCVGQQEIPSANELMTHSIMDLWQSGNYQLMAQLPNPGKHLLDERNYKWLNGTEEVAGLCERLDSTNQSLCYAVGAAHLFVGEANLIAALKNSAFTVEKGSFNYLTSTMEWSRI